MGEKRLWCGYILMDCDHAKLLVVLDFNGTLVDSTHKRRSGATHDAMARHKYVYFRPGLQEFIDWLMACPGVKIAVWTSNIRLNAEALTDIVFGSHRKQLAFIFSRNECITYPDYSSKKPVHKVFDNTAYGPENTLFVDDSPDKVMHADRERFHYQIPEFVAGSTPDDDAELARLRAEIASRLDNL